MTCFWFTSKSTTSLSRTRAFFCRLRTARSGEAMLAGDSDPVATWRAARYPGSPAAVGLSGISILSLFRPAAAAPAAPALGPEDVWVVVNKSVPDSQAVADHYCEKRGVPKDHVIALELPAGED